MALMCSRFLNFRKVSVYISLLSILFAGCASTPTEESRLRAEGAKFLTQCRVDAAAIIPLNNSQGQLTGAKVCVRINAKDEQSAKKAAKQKIIAIVSDMLENNKKIQEDSASYAQSDVFALEQLKMAVRVSSLLSGEKDYSYNSKVKIINTHLSQYSDYRLVENLTVSELRKKNVTQLKALVDQFKGMKLEVASFRTMQNEKIQLIKDELGEKGCNVKATIIYKKIPSRNMALNFKKLLERKLTCANSIVDVRKKSVASNSNTIYFRSSKNSANFSIPRYAAKFIEYFPEDTFIIKHSASDTENSDLDVVIILNDSSTALLKNYFDSEIVTRTPIWSKDATDGVDHTGLWKIFKNKNWHKQWKAQNTKKREWNPANNDPRYTGPPNRYVRVLSDNYSNSTTNEYNPFALVEFLNPKGKIEEGLILSGVLKPQNRKVKSFKLKLNMDNPITDYWYVPRTRMIETTD
jgi:hypothetical protein